MAAIWVRYLGSYVYHQAEVFPIPSDQVPVLVARQIRNREVAEVWYQSNTERFDKRSAWQHYPVQR